MRMSYSSDKLFDTCPRKFQLAKLLDTGQTKREKSGHTMYGSAFGTGVAQFLITGSLDSAIAAAFCNWEHEYELAPKYLQVLFTSLRRFAARFPTDEYELLYLADGKPAVETGTRLWLDAEGKEDYYVLFADAICRHIPTGKPTIVEVKTTKRNDEDVSPYYVNSPQSILYSFPLPWLFPNEEAYNWDTLYVVNQVTDVWNPQIKLLPIEHSATERLQSLIQLMLRYEYIKKMERPVPDDPSIIGLFPKGSGDGICYSFGNLCSFYGVCDYMAQTCKPLPLEEQNEMDEERERDVVLDLHMQTLLHYETTGEIL